MENKEPLIRMENVSRLYHMGEIEVSALKDVTLSIERGEFVALMGSSGSGKSTMLNLLGCLDRPTSGHYFLEGRNVSKLDRDERALIRRKKLGFVFQNFNLLPRTSALENVELPLMYNGGLTAGERTERAMEALKSVGLADRVYHHPSQLSGGQQQRVAIARSLIARPEILLADEPTGNIDSRSGKEILDILEGLNGEGKTLILVTHDPKVAERTRRTITMLDGEITDDTGKG